MRMTHTFELIKQIIKLPYVQQSIDTWTQVDGTATLVRGIDGNAYEIVVRPASETQHPKLKQHTIKKGIREMKSFKELSKQLEESAPTPNSVPTPKFIEPASDTSADVTAIFKALYADAKASGSASLGMEARKLNDVLKGKGYWVSNTKGQFKLNKVGYDSDGKKAPIVQPRGNNA